MKKGEVQGMNMNRHPELDDSLLLDAEYHLRTGGVNWAIALGRHDIQHGAVVLLFSRRTAAVLIVLGGVIPHVPLHFPPNSAPNFHIHTPTVTCDRHYGDVLDGTIKDAINRDRAYTGDNSSRQQPPTVVQDLQDLADAALRAEEGQIATIKLSSSTSIQWESFLSGKRIIVDYTFGGLNAKTLKLAPQRLCSLGRPWNGFCGP
jgi:hypothetical protein